MIGIYFSGTGNTKHCTERLLSLLEDSAECVALESERTEQAIKEHEFIIYAYPTQFFIASDFNDRTIQNEIKLGFSRKSAVVCRAIVALPVSGIIHIIYAAIGAILAGMANGFALKIPLLSINGWSLLVFLEMIAIQSVVVFIVFLCRKVTPGIAVSVCTMVMLCNVLRNLTDGAVFVKLFNMTCFSRMAMDMQAFSILDILITTISALITIVVFVICSVAAFQKAEVE